MAWLLVATLLLGLLGLNAATNGSVLAQTLNNKPPNPTDIMSTPPSSFKTYAKGSWVQDQANSSIHGDFPPITPNRFQWNCTTSPVFTWGDDDNGGTGVFITNADTRNWQAFYVYHDTCDSIPFKYIWIGAGLTQFISLPPLFEGRISRGSDEVISHASQPNLKTTDILKWNLGGIARPLGTWFEFALDNSAWIWGDISLIRGCDGPVLMWSLDTSGSWKGFTQDILDGAPPNAYAMKPSGQWVLEATKAWNGTINTVPRDWELQTVGAAFAYIDDDHGAPVIVSKNGRFGTYWLQGRI